MRNAAPPPPFLDLAPCAACATRPPPFPSPCPLRGMHNAASPHIRPIYKEDMCAPVRACSSPAVKAIISMGEKEKGQGSRQQNGVNGAMPSVRVAPSGGGHLARLAQLGRRRYCNVYSCDKLSCPIAIDLPCCAYSGGAGVWCLEASGAERGGLLAHEIFVGTLVHLSAAVPRCVLETFNQGA
eukprot:363147-Chlamydomonas_euryale.AAC.2